MQSNRTRIRKVFEPLTVASTIHCTSPASPVTQVLNGSNGEYEPDRDLTPTVILPEVVASASDGSWPTPRSNAYLADMKWFVNGKEITTLPDWTGKYSIDQNGSTRGAISISRNMTAGERVELHFEAVLADARLGVNIPVVTDKILLSTVEKAADGYGMSLGDSNIIQYDPVKDQLALYDYELSHGLRTASTADKTAATADKCSYLHTIPVALFCGDTEVTTGVTLKVYRVNSVTSLTQLTAGQDEVVAITSNSVTLDLRLITKSAYVIKAFVKNVEVAMTEVSVSRIYQAYNATPTNGTDIHPLDKERFDQAMVDCDGNIVEHPGRIYRIKWYTDSYYQTAVAHNEGETTLFRLSDTGIGSSYADSGLDVYFDIEYKEAYSTATDSGSTLTDGAGNTYIFN